MSPVYTGMMASWACGYCGTSGWISIDRLERYSRVEVGETHGLWPDIEIMVCEGYPEDYERWRNEFTPRIEAEPGVNWAGVDFSRDDLAALDLSHANLSSCRMRRLSHARLVGADLTWADLVGAELDGVDFAGANLSGADLTGANMTGATIERAASLMGADLTGVIGLTVEQVEACRTKGALFADR